MLAVGHAPEVADDLADAARWYESRQPGLSAIFLQDFRDTVGRIATHGAVHRIVARDYRRLHFKRFPYAVYFVVQGQRATVYLVIDATRDPALISRLLHERH